MSINSALNIGDTVRCVKSASFLSITEGQHYTVSGIGSSTNPNDDEYIQLAEIPGSAFRRERFEPEESE